MFGDFGGFGYNGHDAAQTGRLYKDQPIQDLDINDILSHDNRILGARGTHMGRNNAYMASIVNAMKDGIVGPEGLKFKSTYNFTDDPLENKRLQDQIEASIRKGTSGKRLDAAGLLTTRQIEDSWVSGKSYYGQAIWVRVPAPSRPGAMYAHAWRQITPRRISNPHYAANTKNLRDGARLDNNGRPYALNIASAHPNALNMSDSSSLTWTQVDLYDSTGLEQVIWHANRLYPEQIHGSSWIAPVASLLMHLGNVTEAHVVAKRLQACLGMIIEVDDPVAAARKDRNGEAFTRNTTMQPGKTYYVQRGANVKPFDFKYNGQDFEAFSVALLQAICAGFGTGIPWQFAMQQLPKSNMAAARAALMQAARSFRRNQIDHEHELTIINKNLIAEDLARGRLVLPTGDDLDAALYGYFVPPEKLSADPHRDMQATKLKAEVLDISKTTLARENGGYDLDVEREQRAADKAADDALGLVSTMPVIGALDPEPELDADEDTETVEEDAILENAEGTAA